jgi:predicted outer membrane protein
MQHRIATYLAIASVAAAAAAGLGAARAPVDRSNASAMTNANILAQMMEGDSLEVAMSEVGVDSARNMEVKRFAQRMVTTHTQHMDEVKSTASKAKVTPERAAGDTATAMMAKRMMDRLSDTKPSAARDRLLMESEVYFHTQLLHDIESARADATGPTKQLVEDTEPVVKHHLADARAILRKLGTAS